MSNTSNVSLGLLNPIWIGRYFATYEFTKKALTPAGASPSELNLGAVIMAGGTAGVAMWAIAIPPDVGQFYIVVISSG